jgi:hypothetical protein
MANLHQLYDEDFYRWSLETAAALRAGRLVDLDAEHLAEELESMAGRDKRELESRLAQILEHLLKLRMAKRLILEYNRNGWQASIVRQRGEIDTLLQQSPSLRRSINQEMIAACYRRAAKAVAAQYDVEPPAECPFSVEEIL